MGFNSGFKGLTKFTWTNNNNNNITSLIFVSSSQYDIEVLKRMYKNLGYT